MGKKSERPRRETSKKRKTKPGSHFSRSSRQGAAVAYNPLAHAEFVTGFRKRKNARRLEAQAKATEAEREKLRLARKEKREFIQETAARMRSTISEDEGEIEELVHVTEKSYVLEGEDTVVTTTVSKMATSPHKNLESIKSTLKPSGHEYLRKIGAVKNPARLSIRKRTGMKSSNVQRDGGSKKRSKKRNISFREA